MDDYDTEQLYWLTEVHLALRRKLIPGCKCDIGYTCDICAKKLFRNIKREND